MINILLFSASEDAKQDILASKYNASFDPETEADPKTFVNYDEENDVYDLITVARYPHTYSRSGIQSAITMKVTQDQYDFISTLPSAIDMLATCDNNPDNDYVWEGAGNASEAKFKSVVGQDFFTGSGIIGEEGYIAPRKKLAVLA